MNSGLTNKRPIWSRVIRIILRVILILVVFVLSLVLLINIPAVQTFITNKFVSSIKAKTGTEISIGSVKIVFPKTVEIRDLFVQDQSEDTLLYLHSLNADIELFKLLSNNVLISKIEIDSLVAHVSRKNAESNFNYQFILDALSSQSSDMTTPSEKWLIKIRDISLKNIQANYSDGSADIDLTIVLSDLESTVNSFDPANKELLFEKLVLQETSTQIVSTLNGLTADSLSADNDTNVVKGNDKMKIADLFPDWKMGCNHLSLEDINFKYDNGSFPLIAESFDPRHIHVKDFSTNIDNFSMSGEGLLAEINKLSFSEHCGFKLEKFSVDVQLNEKIAELKKCDFKSSESNFSGNAILSFTSFNDLFTNPGECTVMLELENANVDVSEVFLLKPSLATNELFSKFNNTDVAFNIKADGKINNLNFENLQVSILDKTILKSNARIKGLPDINKISFDANVDLLSTTLTDIYKFIDPKLLAGYNLPESFVVSGSAKGKPDSFRADAKLASTYGIISANALYEKQSKQRDTVNIIFTAKDILTGRIFGDTVFDKANLSGNAAVSRTSDNLFYGTAKLMIDDAFYNSYNYHDILIDARLNGDFYSATVSSVDTNLSFGLTADINLQDSVKRYSADLSLSNMNLQALNFSERNISVSTELKSELAYGSVNNSNANLIFTNTNILNAGDSIPIISLAINALSKPEGIDVEVNSEVIDGRISSNIEAGKIQQIFQAAFGRYFGKESNTDLAHGKNLSFIFNVNATKELFNLLDSNINVLELNRLEGNYSSDKNELSVQVQLPKLVYSGILFDSLSLVVKGENDNLLLNLNCDKASYNNLNIERIQLRELCEGGKIQSEIIIRDSLEAAKYLFANNIELNKDYFRLSFLPDGLILNGTKWDVGSDNYFERRYQTYKNQPAFLVKNFDFKNDVKSVGIYTEYGSQVVRFKNFALYDLLGIVNYKADSGSFGRGAKFISGNLNGDIAFPFFPSIRDINVNLAINDLHILDTLAGDLSFKVKSYADSLDIDASLTNQQNKITLSGNVAQYFQSPVFDLNANIEIENLNQFERFSFGALSQMSGRVMGKMNLTGTVNNPEINGEVGFKKTAFKVNSLNFYAKLNDEKILLTNKGLHFEKFAIEDIRSNKLIIDGDVITNNFSNPEFNMNLSAEKFLPINSTAADNSVFFGKLSMGADVKLRGTVKSPVIDARIRIDSVTNLTYALPGSELKLVTSEGIVEFTDSSQASDSSLVTDQAQHVTDSIMSSMKGVNLKARIEMDPGVQLTIDVDPKSGDYLTVKGGAKFDITSNGIDNQSINGVYEVSSGTYQLSFYDLVKKDFTIKPGSTIAWSGRPMDGDMNITAEYIVRTSSVALVANETPSMSEEEKKIFNRRLPYEVKLNIGGLISKPQISFNISLPSQYLSDNPLIETKLRQLNSPDMTNELNKQVFALLVAGSFMADSPMDNTGGSSNIATTAARNSVNGILASQLNNVSGKYITGVDVNFGLTSYDDYSGGSNGMRTEMDIQVSKKLFNDRLTVEAENSFGLSGSKKEPANSTTAQGYGQFAVIYSLTESGEYKLRAYYQNAYDPFDGDISYSGIALIFEKELDRLWHSGSPAPGQVNEIDK